MSHIHTLPPSLPCTARSACPSISHPLALLAHICFGFHVACLACMHACIAEVEEDKGVLTVEDVYIGMPVTTTLTPADVSDWLQSQQVSQPLMP
jgi:hypothetical protein